LVIDIQTVSLHFGLPICYLVYYLVILFGIADVCIMVQA